MSSDAEPGFTLNGKTIGLIMGIMSLVGVITQSVSYANTLSAKVENHQVWIAKREARGDKLDAKIDQLVESTIELKAAVRSLEAEVRKGSR